MALGFRTRNAAGAILIDTSFRAGRLLGHVDIGAGNQSGSTSIPAMDDGTPFYIFEKFSLNNNRPTVVFDPVAKTMTWTAGSGSYTGKIFYGVY